MKVHELDIMDPRQIDAAVDRALEEAVQEGPYRMAMNHHHTSAIRGYGERETRLEDSIDSSLQYPVELTRNDGGNTWYHSPESRCVMIAVPDTESKNHEEYMRAWGRSLTSQLEDYVENSGLEMDPQYSKGDVYDRNTGKQLLGLSGRSGKNSTVVRACMYDGNDHGELFEDIVSSDLEEDAEQFHNDYLAVDGFYDHMIGKLDTEKLIVEARYENSPRDQGRDPDPCVSRLRAL